MSRYCIICKNFENAKIIVSYVTNYDTFWDRDSNSPDASLSWTKSTLEIQWYANKKLPSNVLKITFKCSENYLQMFWKLPSNVLKITFKCSAHNESLNFLTSPWFMRFGWKHPTAISVSLVPAIDLWLMLALPIMI